MEQGGGTEASLEPPEGWMCVEDVVKKLKADGVPVGTSLTVVRHKLKCLRDAGEIEYTNCKRGRAWVIYYNVVQLPSEVGG